MADVTVPTAPPLATVANVELMHTGTWHISTGVFTFTSDDFHNAVAALDCPAVRRPPLKLGHNEPDPDEQGIRWDGEPAVGYIANMGVADAGRTLVGDYAGMPGWLGGDVIASAYPDRSIEGQYDFYCQMGHCHPFVITAVALLGVERPGIGSLQSLQDVAELYGVAAAASPKPAPASTPFAVRIHAAAREDRVPNPRSPEVSAGVTSDDVRRAFYNSDAGRSWDIWIEEMQLGPELQLIIIDDSTNGRSRVPITIGDGDGQDAVTFGDPVPVVVRYEDAPTTAAASASADSPPVVRFASRAESRPGEPPEADGTAPEPAPAPQPPIVPSAGTSRTQPPPAAQAEATTTDSQEGAGMDPAKIREALGLLPEATDEEVRTALADTDLLPQPEPQTETEPVAPAPAALPDGVVTIDEATLNELREQASQGVAARAQQVTEARDRALDDAVRAGKFPPVRRDHWAGYWDKDPEGAKAALASLEPGLVPVQDAGVPGGEETNDGGNDEFDSIFSRPAPTKTGV